MVDIQSQLNPLWGATINDLRIDLAESRIVIYLTVLNNGKLSKYQLVLAFVKSIQYVNRLLERWNYVELTEVKAKHVDTDWHVNLDFWDIASMDVICVEVLLQDVTNIDAR